MRTAPHRAMNLAWLYGATPTRGGRASAGGGGVPIAPSFRAAFAMDGLIAVAFTGWRVRGLRQL